MTREKPGASTPWTIDTTTVYCFDNGRGENLSLDNVSDKRRGDQLSTDIVRAYSRGVPIVSLWCASAK